MTSPMTDDVVQVQERGRVPQGSADYAERKVRVALRVIRQPVLYARIVLAQAADPAVRKRSVAQVAVDVNGHAVHVHSDAATMREAIDKLADTLRRRLEDLDRTWETPRREGRRAH